MRVSTKNALSIGLFSVAERALCYLRGQAQPSCVETVKVAGKPLLSGVNLLKPQKNKLSKMCNAKIPDGKAIKLVTMDSQVLFSGVNPFILLIHRDSHQV